MDYIIEFYKNLDTLNLIIFWGVIIVIILLLIFSIILVNKNKNLKLLIENSQKARKEIIDDKNQIQDVPIKENNNFIEKNNEETTISSNKIIVPSQNEEKKFIAEEYIYNYKNSNEDNKKNYETKVDNDITNEKKEVVIPNKPYQKNVLREMSLNQTSPIGIVRNNYNNELDNKKAEELHSILDTEKEISSIHNNMNNEKKVPVTNQIKESKIVETTINKSFNEIEQTKNNDKKEYLKEVSKKLNDAINDIARTEYEIKQEEEAIISYEELMKKKDTIQTIEEEEAVISIEELYQKEKNKLYGITEKEPDDKFIDELKNFRSDL